MTHRERQGDRQQRTYYNKYQTVVRSINAEQDAATPCCWPRLSGKSGLGMYDLCWDYCKAFVTGDL